MPRVKQPVIPPVRVLEVAALGIGPRPPRAWLALPSGGVPYGGFGVPANRRWLLELVGDGPVLEIPSDPRICQAVGSGGRLAFHGFGEDVLELCSWVPIADDASGDAASVRAPASAYAAITAGEYPALDIDYTVVTILRWLREEVHRGGVAWWRASGGVHFGSVSRALPDISPGDQIALIYIVCRWQYPDGCALVVSDPGGDETLFVEDSELGRELVAERFGPIENLEAAAPTSAGVSQSSQGTQSTQEA